MHLVTDLLDALLATTLSISVFKLNSLLTGANESSFLLDYGHFACISMTMKCYLGQAHCENFFYPPLRPTTCNSISTWIDNR